MLAARLDQENVVDSRRVAAPSKNGRNRLPRTPAVKKQPYIDDGGEQTCQHLKPAGKESTGAFLTPVARIARAPLGAKTTNAKGFTTKVPIRGGSDDGVVPATAKRTRRAHFRVHQPELSDDDKEEEEDREVEYMPPRGEPLPDLPDDDIWPHDRTYEQFEGGNFSRGWSAFLTQFDGDSDFDEEYEKALATDLQAAHGKKAGTKPSQPKTPGSAAQRVLKPASGGYASATTASLARARTTPALTGKMPARPQSAVSKQSVSTSKGLAVQSRKAVSRGEGLQGKQEVRHQPAPFMDSLCSQIDQFLADDSHSLEQGSTPLGLLELEGLYGFQLELPDD